MHSRQSLFERFSTFIEFRADRFYRWVTDPKLRRNLERHHAQLSELPPSEDSWVLYWYTCWKKQSDEYALGHLSAYLQEACYWSAQRVVRFLENTTYGLSDCFQLASIDIEKVLTGYEPRRGASLKGYARIVYASSIRDTLRQRQEVDICTVWALLRRVSKQRLIEALRHAGLSTSAIAQYRLVWRCYKSLYGAGRAPTRRLRGPDRSQFSAIATLYNRERLTQLPDPGPTLGPDSLEQRLTQCAAWVREYMYPPVRSLNAPRPNREASELQDALSDSLQSLFQPAQPVMMAAMIAQEERQHRQLRHGQIKKVLAAALNQLTPEKQEILRLYYHDGRTQVQIAQQLDLKQYTVSRRLNRVRATLLSALIGWGQKTLHIVHSPDLITNMSVALEDWLTDYYRD